MARKAIRRVAFMKKERRLQGVSSRCPARVEYSIDQSQRFRELRVLNRNFISSGAIDGRVDAIAQSAYLFGIEHGRPDRRLPAPVDEVVRADLRELELR